jgi:hypothetical protein
MSDGFQVAQNPEFPAQAQAVASNCNYLLIDTASAPDDGAWINWTPFSRAALEVTSPTAEPDFSLELMGSNAATIPANSADGSVIGSAITTVGMILVTMPCRWLKVKLTACTDTTLSATINGVAP